MILERLKKSFKKDPNEAFYFLNPSLNPQIQKKLLEDIQKFKPQSDVFLFSTSGTSTGMPQWVVHSRDSLLGNAREVQKKYFLSKGDKFLLCLPLYHVGGFGILARAELCEGNVEVLGVPKGKAFDVLNPQYRAQWSALEFFNDIQDKKIQWSSLVPTQVFDLLKLELRAPSCLQGLWIGGDFLDPALWQKGRELGWPLIKTYGMTETASMFAGQSVGDSEDLDPTLFEGWKLSKDSLGKIWIEGPGLLESYLGGDKITRFLCPDLVELNEKNQIRVLGRESQVKKILGEFVNLNELESRIFMAFPEFYGKLCLGFLKDERKGQKIALFFEGGQIRESNLENLKNWAGKNFSAWEKLSDFIEIRAMPRNVLGKIQRNLLPELANG